MDGYGLLLLEEPELSLHSSIVRLIPSVMYRLTRQSRRQVLIATHSAELLSDESIGSGEILMLIPGEHGTSIFSAGSDTVIRCLMEQGMPASEAVVPVTAPGNYSPAELRRW